MDTSMDFERMQLDLLNRVPVGVGIYQVENGIPSLIFLNDSYYEMLGVSRSDRARFLGQAAIHAIHPADRSALLAGIQRALDTEQSTRTVVRVMANAPGDYHWMQVEGKPTARSGGRATFYVSFTIVDELQQAKSELKKSQLSLRSALASANMRYFEYIPDEHAAILYEEANGFRLPTRLENYPQCWFDLKLTHPEDEARLHRAFADIHAGAPHVTWEGRLLVDGRYRWHKCTFAAVPDPIHARKIVVCTLTDESLQKEALMAYQSHMDSVIRTNPNAIAAFRLNLTQGTCGAGPSVYPNTHQNLRSLQEQGDVDAFFRLAQSLVPDKVSRERFGTLFDRAALLHGFESGQRTVSLEHRYLLEPGRTEWITTSMDLMRNPSTGDVEGVLYILNVNKRRMEHLAILGMMQQAYDCIIIVDFDTWEYFLFDHVQNDFGTHCTDFRADSDRILQARMSAEEWLRLSPVLSVHAMVSELKKHDSYTTSFFAESADGRTMRKQVRYGYIGKKRKIVMVSIQDFTDQELLQQFRHASQHDPITGLYNRPKTFQECRLLLNSHPEERFAICHFDIQRFHLVNSFYGEEAGNALLRGLAKLFTRLAQSYDYGVYGRIDADEFCMCFPYRPELLKSHINIIRHWLSGYRNDFFLEGRFGVYLVTDYSIPVDSMFSRATIAAKSGSKAMLHGFSIYDNEMEQHLLAEQEITNEMRAALEQEQFHVYLQPKYSLDKRQPCGAEALVRWIHPEKGIISPGQFIPLFEKNGFIIQLDRYMWEHVCRLLRGWLDAGYHPSPISVNVSRVSMYSPHTTTFLNSLMEQYALPHSLLQLELTESAYMDDPDEMKLRLCQLQADGFSILMDDFGSGYSSLNTLKELPVDYLKVDMKFLSTAQDSERSRLVLASVVRMACWLQLPVITEGVETPEQRDFLSGIGCTYAQGYLFARPMPAADYERDFLRQYTPPTALVQDQLSTIAQMITNTNPIAHFFIERLPLPLAFVDLMEQGFAYLRANGDFQRTFGMGLDLIDAKLLQERHISKDDYQALLAAYRKSANTASQSECIFYWRDDHQAVRCYLMRAQYLGRSAYSAILLATFHDVTDYHRFEEPQVRALQPFRNRFTAPQIAEIVHTLNNIFDLVRVVQPERHAIVRVDAAWKQTAYPDVCYTCWGRSSGCENCISRQALTENRPLFKLERHGQDYMLLTAYPLELTEEDGSTQSAALELAIKADSAMLSALTGTAAAGDKTVLHYKRLAYQDPLTGAWNRRYYNDMLYWDPDRCENQDAGLAFILMDICDLSQINDCYGHSESDRLLTHIAAELQRNIRPFDSLIRYGGNQFLIVLPGCSKDAVEQRAETLQRMVERIRLGASQTDCARVRVGYAFQPAFDGRSETAAALSRRADESLAQRRWAKATSK